MKDKWKHRLQQLEQANLARHLRVSGVGPQVQTAEGEKWVFCSNDYLGLAVSPRVSAAASAEMSAGLGAGASRLVSGNFPWHQQLEQRFAGFAGKEDSVLFPSGYQANVGAISALTDENDVVFSDRLSHASIIDGCRLSKATVEIFEHNNTADLARRLALYDAHPGGKIIVTEAIFSMDGDIPPLREICELAEQHGAAVYLDEAHSLGIIGPKGKGLAAQLGVTCKIDVLVGTFGKAIGVSGAAVAADSMVCCLLKSQARSLMYTTAPPPCLSRAVCESLDIIEDADDLRAKLKQNIQLFKQLANDHQLSLVQSDTPIQPVLIGSASETMRISAALWERGLFVQGIRPPTVPEGTERLRITITANHTPSQIEKLIAALVDCGVTI